MILVLFPSFSGDDDEPVAEFLRELGLGRTLVSKCRNLNGILPLPHSSLLLLLNKNAKGQEIQELPVVVGELITTEAVVGSVGEVISVDTRGVPLLIAGLYIFGSDTILTKKLRFCAKV